MKIHLSASDDLDAALFDNRRPGTEFVLAPGVHTTRGIWWHGRNWEQVLAPGCRVRPDNGRWEIQLAADCVRSLDGAPRPENDVRVMTHGEGARWEGGYINGMYRNKPDVFVKAALRGRSATLVDMEFGGCRGSYERKVEAFPLSLVGPGASQLGGTTRILDCAPNSYCSGINFGHVGGTGLTVACKLEFDFGDGNWFAIGINERVRVSGVTVKSQLFHFAYNDTGPTDDVAIRGVDLVGGVPRVLCLKVMPGDATFKGNVLLEGIRGEVLGDSEGQARFIEIWDQAGMGTTGTVLAHGCDLKSSAALFYAISTVTTSLAPVVVAASVLPPRPLVNGRGTILHCTQ